jgi:hypothetical protein
MYDGEGIGFELDGNIIISKQLKCKDKFNILHLVRVACGLFSLAETEYKDIYSIPREWSGQV